MAIGEIRSRLVKRSDGTSYILYEGEYRDRDGKRCFKSDRNKHKAQAKLRKAMNEVDAKTHSKATITLGEVFDEHIYDREKSACRIDKTTGKGDVSKGHVGNEKYNLSKIPDRLLRKKIADFQHSGEFEELAKDLRDQGLSIRTVEGVLGTISRVFTFAMKPIRGYVPRNVLIDYPVRLGKAPKRTNVFTTEDAAHLLSVAWQEIEEIEQGRKGAKLQVAVNLFALAFLASHTGIRPQEAFGLQAEDIRRFDYPPPNMPNVWGEAIIRNTNTPKEKFQRRTKTDEDRTVQLTKGAIDALNLVERFWQAKRYAERPGVYESYSTSCLSARTRRSFRTLDAPLEVRKYGFVFLTECGNAYNSVTISRPLSALIVRAGLVQRDEEGRILLGPDGNKRHKYTLYSFRHMVCTHNAQNLPTHLGASVTGHGEQTFLETYVHATADDKRLIAESLGKLETKLIATDVQQRPPSG